jgi:hypothetical protein
MVPLGVIVTSLIVILAALAGWLAGLTAHTFAVSRWNDPGARAAWAAMASVGIAVTLLPSLALGLEARSGPFLSVIPASLLGGGVLAWRVSEGLRSLHHATNGPPGRALDSLTRDRSKPRALSAWCRLAGAGNRRWSPDGGKSASSDDNASNGA